MTPAKVPVCRHCRKLALGRFIVSVGVDVRTNEHTESYTAEYRCPETFDLAEPEWVDLPYPIHFGV
jgi:hypothetical protein